MMSSDAQLSLWVDIMALYFYRYANRYGKKKRSSACRATLGAGLSRCPSQYVDLDKELYFSSQKKGRTYFIIIISINRSPELDIGLMQEVPNTTVLCRFGSTGTMIMSYVHFVGIYRHCVYRCEVSIPAHWDPNVT
ncbi:jg12493 [Pararge aegeria aegeria]|uniref:Jg12493 protein n=1 Tax=Pararge aegeria aegeria TaxID=348720 RepID=A0A8S4R4U1_9NEOP|nr:jg12493 [Pararge aegeria aegeria]